MKVMSKPQGWGRFTISLSRRTLREKSHVIYTEKKMHNNSKNSPRDLLLKSFGIGFGKQAEKDAAKIVRVAIWIAKLVGNCINE